MMFCNKCGNQNNEGSSFCVKCGMPLLNNQVRTTENTVNNFVNNEHNGVNEVNNISTPSVANDFSLNNQVNAGMANNFSVPNNQVNNGINGQPNFNNQNNSKKTLLIVIGIIGVLVVIGIVILGIIFVGSKAKDAIDDNFNVTNNNASLDDLDDASESEYNHTNMGGIMVMIPKGWQQTTVSNTQSAYQSPAGTEVIGVTKEYVGSGEELFTSTYMDALNSSGFTCSAAGKGYSNSNLEVDKINCTYSSGSAKLYIAFKDSYVYVVMMSSNGSTNSDELWNKILKELKFA